jgi:hypothetical protein
MEHPIRSAIVQGLLFLPVGLIFAWFGALVCVAAALMWGTNKLFRGM